MSVTICLQDPKEHDDDSDKQDIFASAFHVPVILYSNVSIVFTTVNGTFFFPGRCLIPPTIVLTAGMN